MLHGDDKGLLLPPNVAPIQVVIVPIYRDDVAKVVKEKAEQVANILRKSGIRTEVDGRDEYTSGWKFNEWELKGVPLRISIGLRDIKKREVELVRRDTIEKSVVVESELVECVFSALREIQNNLLLRAKKTLMEYSAEAKAYDSFKSILDNEGGFIYAGWCEDQRCETNIKQETGADIRVLPFEGQERIDVLSNCVYCGKPSEKIAIYARSY
jgi:prolyl-tRNA synthetase